MMNEQDLHIICLVKIVEELDDISPNEYRKAEEGRLDLSYVKRMINCFDEAALEYALKIKEKRGEAGLETRISVLSVNPGYASPFLKPLFAIKVDDVIVLETDRPLSFSPSDTARVLYSQIEKIREKDCRLLIFAGRQAPPLNSGLVPVFIAEYLGLPAIRDLYDLCWEEDKLTAQRTGGDCFELYQIDRDMVLVFASTRFSFLRVPTLREKMKYKKWEPELVSCSLDQTYELDGEGARETGQAGPCSEPALYCPKNEIDCQMIAVEDESEAADYLFNQFLLEST